MPDRDIHFKRFALANTSVNFKSDALIARESLNEDRDVAPMLASKWLNLISKKGRDVGDDSIRQAVERIITKCKSYGSRGY